MIFLDLYKVYDALDRSRCLEILEGYGVGPRAQQLLRAYWGKMMMVARAGGYYGGAFKGARGVTQGNPLSPTIFNVVVDAVVRHWVNLMPTLLPTLAPLFRALHNCLVRRSEERRARQLYT